ncbi:LEA14-like dessication related protein [Catalinimonas alkaloidigena]|uniref:hypothetical protein n=1 Tax=Catalinimonas alkaloidigena TaxID=1075417 RepID=UPI002406B65B|nr:hypothetical protein [Catalinimonas alkaloidigena]MDF9800020.1 LEA14-like dessication related protein [Catalinimonas alkaloidigena]
MDFKELYQIAKKAIVSTLGEDEPTDIRLEQAEFSEDSGYWEVVVSFLVENKNLSPLNIGALRYERIYKLVKINDEKEVKGIYMFSHV